jgi:membrane associated rhomboid family serine protease
MTYKSQFGGMGMGRGVMPPVIKYLIIINVAIFILQFLFLSQFTVPSPFDGSISRISLTNLMRLYFGLNPISDFNSLDILMTPVQLITYQFLHGDFTHILFNMFALWMFGMELENLWGSKKFLIYYLLSGIGAGIFQLIIPPLLGSAGLTIGASGSIFGVLLAFGLSFPNRSVFMFPIFIPIPAKTFVLIIGGLQILFGFLSNDGVAYFAHLGGAITGWFLLKFGDDIGLFSLFGASKRQTYQEPVFKEKQYYSREPKIYQFDKEYQSNKSNPVSNKPSSSKSYTIDGVEIPQEMLDEILDKISATGYQNLTEKEKHILNELSKKL